MRACVHDRGPSKAHPLAELPAHVDVFGRKRPLFAHEEAQDEFAGVTITGPQQCTVHNTPRCTPT